MRQLKITQQITTRESIALQKYLAEVSSIPLLTLQEEFELSGKIKEGDEKALKRFIEGNLRFVISVAKQYQGSGEKLDDLINAGNEGLMVAAKRFDNSRGFKFISYAVWWIRQSIMLYLTECSKGMRLPANKIAIVTKIRNVTSSLEQNLQRPPTLEEIQEGILALESTKVLNISPLEIEQMIIASTPLTSLDMKLSEESDSSLSDVLVVEDSVESVNDVIHKQDLSSTLHRLLDKKLSHREKEVLIMNFGLFGTPQKTLEEIGVTFDLTRERVRQIREKSLRKLKWGTASQQIKEYM